MAQALSRACGRLLSSAGTKQRSTRFCTSDLLKKKRGTEEGSLVQKSGWIRKTLLDAFMRFVRGYESILESRFPRTFHVYRVFTIGSRDFYNDVVTYIRVSKEIRNGKKFQDLTRREIEIYFEMPKQLMKVAPILIFSTLPFTNYIVFPLVYWFPRQLLSYHFWSIQQRMDFALFYHKKRLFNYRPVFRQLQASTTNIANGDLQERCLSMWHKLGSGVHPEIDDILAVRSAFQDKPFSLTALSSGHLSGLCRIHGLSPWGFHRHRLWMHAGILSELDSAIQRESLETLNVDDLRRACFVRGLNPVGMQNEDMLKFLQQWTALSSKIKSNELSLLLHCPIFLTYNHPTNWSLIH